MFGKFGGWFTTEPHCGFSKKKIRRNKGRIYGQVTYSVGKNM